MGISCSVKYTTMLDLFFLFVLNGVGDWTGDLSGCGGNGFGAACGKVDMRDRCFDTISLKRPQGELPDEHAFIWID